MTHAFLRGTPDIWALFEYEVKVALSPSHLNKSLKPDAGCRNAHGEAAWEMLHQFGPGLHQKGQMKQRAQVEATKWKSMLILHTVQSLLELKAHLLSNAIFLQQFAKRVILCFFQAEQGW